MGGGGRGGGGGGEGAGTRRAAKGSDWDPLQTASGLDCSRWQQVDKGGGKMSRLPVEAD